MATSNGVKRSRAEFESDVDKPSKHLEVPLSRSPSREATPTSFTAVHRDKDYQSFHDDVNQEYEWIRIPKNRDWDLFQVARDEPDRTAAEIPLVATKHDGSSVTMWAKMDTGADTNLINRSTLEALFGQSAEKVLRHNTLDVCKEFAAAGNGHFETKYNVRLDFVAGRSKKKFSNVHFDVITDDWADPDGDGVPNVLLGYHFLHENSMIMVDLEYHHDADPSLEVIADRAEDERPAQSRILITKFDPTKGVVRPKPVSKPKPVPKPQPRPILT